MVGGIEVIKTLTADMDADSFGGTINLVTRSAFDLKERSLNGKFEYIHNAFRKQPGYASRHVPGCARQGPHARAERHADLPAGGPDDQFLRAGVLRRRP
jgi:hypothetical protein